ncbi:hypothetical protein [Aminicella lysinilytica]|uniref:Uncharacterized protein n=1 Tax=Aminicella lysinilytica TaxID=433323 RepID=A0A4R6PYR8_9FIRM|nr:hypothetical protein [Aminicella lysinilytica]NLD11698.1 hypothetical protein [Clostridiales bacterium]TDP52396.1 hypothetical protein EV211_1262 [Aminicella lysinilytica]
MALFDKITDAAKMAGDRAGDAIELTKLKGKVSAERKEIDIEFAKIGKIYYEKAKAGEELEQDAMDICERVDAHNKTIDELQESIEGLTRE